MGRPLHMAELDFARCRVGVHIDRHGDLEHFFVLVPCNIVDDVEASRPSAQHESLHDA